ncbi:uncharacterized protein LOC129003930 [Macrosteles quadrilineatus]|uniref:uncharacterized protein LOC129003930 n=1 Tax=Macrosteles quadrilineatus TaxID=74068 RepID=UPI0023E2B5A4|nr:uncharacterized protein LOC129003930 [Macrosteles quadrilineatus]
MTQKLPEWLDKTFLQAALQGGEDNEPKVTVNDFTAELAVAAGNNYTSQIFRVVVKYTANGSEDKSTTLIVKAPHTQLQDMGAELGLSEWFDKEPVIYNIILPKMKEKIKVDFGPKTYYSAQKSVLVFQDLKETGHIMCDKFKQLDYAHCEVVLKSLAKFHAVSVALHSENPEEIETLGIEPIFREGNPMKELMKSLLVFAIEIVKESLKNTENGEPALQFLLDKQETLYNSLIEIVKPKKEGLNVMNHGDLWNNNMMFKHSESGEVEEVKFIDFQVLRYMSPAIDILYFTWTSADEEVRENRLQELYDIYLQELNECLQLLGCKERYTSEELWQDLKSSVDFALVVACQTLPMTLAEEKDALDMAEFDMKEFANMSNTGAMDPNLLRLYNGKNFKAKVPKIIQQIYQTLH